MNKPSTELEIKGNDWQFCCRGELLMYVPEYTKDITIICGSDRADAQISVVKPQRFDAETSFIDACCNCNVRGTADDPEHICSVAVA